VLRVYSRSWGSAVPGGIRDPGRAISIATKSHNRLIDGWSMRAT